MSTEQSISKPLTKNKEPSLSNTGYDNKEDLSNEICDVSHINCHSDSVTNANHHISNNTTSDEVIFVKQQQKRQTKKLKYDQISKLEMTDVVYDEKSGLATRIGEHNIVNLTNDCLKAFIANKCYKDPSYTPSHQSKDDLIKIITHFKNSNNLRKVLKENDKKRSISNTNYSTKPKSVTNIPNTYYRVISVILSDAGKDLFQYTREKQNRKELDKQHPFKETYESLLKLYQNDKQFNKLDSKFHSKTEDSEKSIDMCSFKKSDTLESWMELKHVIEYIIQQYRNVCNNKNKSGMHDNFELYTNGKGYLHYIYLCLEERGNDVFSNCFYPKLQAGILRCSTIMDNEEYSSPAKRRKNEQENLKRAFEIGCMESRKKAHESIEMKNKTSITSISNERISELTEKLFGLKREYLKLEIKTKDHNNILIKEKNVKKRDSIKLDLKLFQIDKTELIIKQKQIQDQLKDLSNTSSVKVDDMMLSDKFIFNV